MTAQPTHTPTPWNVETEQVPFLPKNQGGGMKVRIMGARQCPPIYQGTDPKAFADAMTATVSRDRVCTLNVGLTPEMARANAAFIVRAVNSHEELLGIVKFLNKWCEHGTMVSPSSIYEDLPNGDTITLGQAVKQALARAGEGAR